MKDRKNIFIIVPPTGLYRRDDRCQSKVEDQTVQVIFPPVDLAVIGAIAKQCEYEVMLKDYPAEGQGIDSFKKDLATFNPDYLYIPVTSATIKSDLDIIHEAKKIKPEIVTIGKGEYLAFFAEKILSMNPSLDIIINGEPELIIRDILSKINVDNIPGIIFRHRDSIQRNQPNAFIDNLDQIPLPDRSLLKNHLYKSPENGRKITVINAARGCPSQCIFCSASRVSGKKIRLRSPDNIIKEIEDCVKNYQIYDFLFNGDTFTFKKEWIKELCSKIIDSKFNIHWGCNSRIDTIDEERLEYMKKAGCWVVAFGVESGDQKVLDAMKKGTRLSQIKNAIEITKKAGLRTHAFFVIGTPAETHETLQNTYEFAKDLDTDFFDFNIAYPLPGTELYDMLEAQGIIEQEDFAMGSYSQAMVQAGSLSSEELQKWRKKTLLKLYLRPRYILRTLIKARSPRIMFYYFRSALRRLKNLIKG